MLAREGEGAPLAYAPVHHRHGRLKAWMRDPFDDVR
jgi:hypothetical protein